MPNGVPLGNPNGIPLGGSKTLFFQIIVFKNIVRFGFTSGSRINGDWMTVQLVAQFGCGLDFESETLLLFLKTRLFDVSHWLIFFARDLDVRCSFESSYLIEKCDFWNKLGYKEMPERKQLTTFDHRWKLGRELERVFEIVKGESMWKFLSCSMAFVLFSDFGPSSIDIFVIRFSLNCSFGVMCKVVVE